MKYFRHQKYSSFQRQLNLYGFRKISKGADTGAYTHDHFVKDGTDMLTLVRRMPQSSSRTSAASSTTSHNNTLKTSSTGKKSAGSISTGKNTIATAVSRLSECVRRPKSIANSSTKIKKTPSSQGRRIRLKRSPTAQPTPSPPPTVSNVSLMQVASRPRVQGGALEQFPVARATPVDVHNAFDAPSTPVHTTQPIPAPSSRSSSADTSASDVSDTYSLGDEDFVGDGASLLRMGSNFDFSFGDDESPMDENDHEEMKQSDSTSRWPLPIEPLSANPAPSPHQLNPLSPIVTFQPKATSEKPQLAKALGESDSSVKVLSEHVRSIQIGEPLWMKAPDESILDDESIKIPSLVPLSSTLSSLGFTVDDVIPQGDNIIDDDKSMQKWYSNSYINTTTTAISTDLDNDILKSRCRSVSMSSDDWGIPAGIDEKLIFDEFAFPSTPFQNQGKQPELFSHVNAPDCVEMER